MLIKLLNGGYMSSLVICKLTVTGCKEDLVSFNGRIIDNQLLKSFVPTPQELLDTKLEFPIFRGNPEQEKANFEKYGERNWYEWNLHNLGTPSSFSDIKLLSESDKSLTYCVGFKWNIPEMGIEKVSRLYPSLTFCLAEIEDEYSVFYGDIAWRDGAMIYDNLVESERTSP
jgi:hypothetical protein